VLVSQLADALKTQGVVLALQVIKNVAGLHVATDPKMALGMLTAVKTLQSLAVLVPEKKEFDPTKQWMMEGVGPVDLDLLPEELRKEPAPPPQ